MSMILPPPLSEASTQFTATPRTTGRRAKERFNYDKVAAYQILDEALFCNVAFVGPDGGPRVLPTFHARIGDTLYFHGSTGSALGLGGQDGLEVCVTATVVDGLIFAKSWTHHSMNYRSVVAHGLAIAVGDENERWAAMRASVERMSAGRSERSREPSPKEDAATAVLALQLKDVSVKERAGGPNDDPDDAELSYRTGVAEVTTTVSGRL
jgi:nitroimidazol reductase NimA-like FMN-containing flavoprotein (pyridoxamine 5'-phosphate oxidase superfamily)